MTTDLDANKSIIRDFVAAWNERDFDRFDTLMADDAVLAVGGISISCDPAGTRAIASEWTTAFPDWQFELLDLIAEGDRVVAHMPYTGTFTQPISDVSPTGRFAGRRNGHLPDRRRQGRRSMGGVRRSRHVAPTRHRATFRMTPRTARSARPVDESRRRAWTRCLYQVISGGASKNRTCDLILIRDAL